MFLLLNDRLNGRLLQWIDRASFNLFEKQWNAHNMLHWGNQKVSQLKLLTTRITIAPLNKTNVLTQERKVVRLVKTNLFKLSKLNLPSKRFKVVECINVVKRVTVISLSQCRSSSTLLEDFDENGRHADFIA